jgi:hypothetical protein
MSQFLFTMPAMVTEIHTRFRVKKMPGSHSFTITKLISIGISIVDFTNKWFCLHLIFYVTYIRATLATKNSTLWSEALPSLLQPLSRGWLLIARAIRKMHRVILSEVSFLFSHSFNKFRYKNYYFIIFLEGG